MDRENSHACKLHCRAVQDNAGQCRKVQDIKAVSSNLGVLHAADNIIRDCAVPIGLFFIEKELCKQLRM
jgi:hypothetical protein